MKKWRRQKKKKRKGARIIRRSAFFTCPVREHVGPARRPMGGRGGEEEDGQGRFSAECERARRWTRGRTSGRRRVSCRPTASGAIVIIISFVISLTYDKCSSEPED